MATAFHFLISNRGGTEPDATFGTVTAGVVSLFLREEIKIRFRKIYKQKFKKVNDLVWCEILKSHATSKQSTVVTTLILQRIDLYERTYLD